MAILPLCRPPPPPPPPPLQGSDDWVSMAVPAEGSYGLGSGFFYSVPVTCPGGGPVKRVGGIPIAPALAEAMEAQRVALAK